MHFHLIEMSGTEIGNHLNTLTHYSLLDSLGWALIHSLWQGALAAFFVFGFRTVFKKTSPALRYAVQITTLFTLFAAFISTVLLYQSQTIASTVNTTKLAFTIPLPTQIPLPVLEGINLSGVSSVAMNDFQIISELGQMTPIISLIWGIGFLYLMLRYSAAYILTLKLRKTGLSNVPTEWADRFKTLLLNTGVCAHVELFYSAHIQGPMTLGFFKPIVLVPAQFFTCLNSDQIEAVLLHEIAHIRRYDYIINLLQIMIKSVFFFHPAIHYISRQIDEDREQACDDISVSQTQNPKALARGLATLRFTQNQTASRVSLTSDLADTPPSSISYMSSGVFAMDATGTQESALVLRLKRLIGKDVRTRKAEHILLTTLTVILIASLGLSASPLKATATEPDLNPRSIFESLDIIWPENTKLETITDRKVKHLNDLDPSGITHVQIQAQIEHRIQAHVEQQAQKTERQIKQAELRAKERKKQTEFRLEKNRHAQGTAEPVRVKAVEKRRNKEVHKPHKNYDKFQKTLTQFLLSDGLIRSKTEPYKMTYADGQIIVNGAPVPYALTDKYCSIFNQYGVFKNSKLKIKSGPKTFTLSSQFRNKKHVNL